MALGGNGWPVKEERKAKASLSFPGRRHRFPVVLVGCLTKKIPTCRYLLHLDIWLDASLEFSHQSHSSLALPSRGFDNDTLLLQYGIYALVCFADEYIY